MNELPTDIAIARYGLKQRFQDLQNCVKKRDSNLFLSARDAYFEYVQNDGIFKKILGEDLKSGLMPSEELSFEEWLDIGSGTIDEIKKDFDAIHQVHDILVKGLDEALSFIGYSEEEIPAKVVNTTEKNGKPYLEIKGGKGHLKMNERSKMIPIGDKDGRRFRLLQILCIPIFGVEVKTDIIWGHIKQSKDEFDNDLKDGYRRPQKIISIIDNTIKELEKKKYGLQGKIKFRHNEYKSTYWLTLIED